MRFFLVLTFLIFTASANAACYTAEESEAERFLRIHSELLVIGLNCQHRRDLGNTYQDYQLFTAQNEAYIMHYETIMQRFFLKQGIGDASRELHNFRTAVANRISQDAAVRPDGFCDVYGPRLKFAKALNHTSLSQWARKYPASHPVCGQY